MALSLLILGLSRLELDLIYSLLYILILPGFATALLITLFIIWFERKAAARVQMRYGPLWVSRRTGGIIQLLADGIRFSFQEFILPAGADALPFVFLPGLLLSFSLMPVVFTPVAPAYAILFPAGYTLILAAAFTMIIPVLLVVLGWAADNKFSFLGSLREAYLLISYEVPFLISVASMFLIYRTLDLSFAVLEQKSLPGLLSNPLAAIVFLLVVIRSTGRVPYDIVEADSELVFGPYTEYSSLMFGLVMGVPYMELYGYSLLFSVLFLAGWLPISGTGWLMGFIVPAVVTVLKALIVMCFLVFLRSVYPRFKLNRAMEVGWGWVMYLALAGLLLSVIEVAIGW